MDSAEPKGQSRAERNWFCMTLPTRAAFAPPMTSGTTNMPRGRNEDQYRPCRKCRASSEAG